MTGKLSFFYRQSLFVICLFYSILVFGQENIGNTNNYYSQSAYGGVGLIVMPTARFHEDGEFLFGVSSEVPFNRLYSKMQILPWAEAVVRYTEGTFIAYNVGSKQTWKDKGLDVKFRLFNEGKYLPEIALGLGDIGGQGAFGREFLVASKRVKDFDFTMGMGWGRFAGLDHISNPRGWFQDDYVLRAYGAKRGGKLNIGRLFSGKYTSIYGGFEYSTPIPNLSLKVEYDSTNYSKEEGREKYFLEQGDIMSVDSRINYGLNYHYRPSERDRIDLSLGVVRGNTLYANFAIHSNLNLKSKQKIIPPKENLNEPTLERYEQLNANWQKYLTDLITWQMANEGFFTQRIIFNDDEIQAEVTNGRFWDTKTAIDLASRVLANNAPKNIKKITVINVDQGIETFRASISRDKLVKAASNGPVDDSLYEFNNYERLASKASIIDNQDLYPRFSWSLKPHSLGTLQHQIKFYFWQIEALLNVNYAIRKNFNFTADYGFDIANNFEDYTYHIQDGELHHVRQDRRLYLVNGTSGLRRAQFDYFWDINPNLKAKATAGILEWMYGGYGGELLYLPDNRYWALGIDSYWVKQRGFDQKFSFQDYETVTGFLTFYLDLPFYNLRTKISMGKFLGKDKGAIIDISRRFASGARVGGKVALTDCDAACVGEGSFNKWIYFQLPMDLFFQKDSTRSIAPYEWAPLTKDAGQKVHAGGLYDMVMSAVENTDSLRREQWLPKDENPKKKAYSFRKILAGFDTKPKEPI
jgi:hypothetical protein